MSKPSSTAVASVLGGAYTAHNIKVEVVKGPPYTHLFPVIEDLEVGEKKEVNPSSVEKIRTLQEKKKTVERLSIYYKGKTEEEIRQQLQPAVLHYQMQLLLLAERTQRRVLMNKETTEFITTTVHFQYGIPLKQKIINQFSSEQSAKLLEETLQSNMNFISDAPPELSATRQLAPGALEVLNDSMVNFESTVNKLLDLTATPEKTV